jgi:aldehyde dehydrogenase (NAD+)
MQRYEAMEYAAAPEGRGEADKWLASRKFDQALFIAGEWRKAASGKTFDVREPSTGKKLCAVSEAGKADIDEAVAAARKALPRWQAAGGYARARVLYAIGRAMQRNARLFAVLESIDNGKPIRESRDIDVPLAVRHFIHHAGWAQRLDREFPDHAGVGVAGQIIPWNFPLLMLAWKTAGWLGLDRWLLPALGTPWDPSPAAGPGVSPGPSRAGKPVA